jgi:hypothetical protein
MRDHIRILGILNMVMGGLTAAFGVIVLLAVGTIAGFVSASIGASTGDYHDAAAAVPIIGLVALVAGSFFILLGLPSIIGGWGLMHFRPWSRILMIVISALHLFHVPLGTALGIYGLWVLLNTESQRILESGGRYVPAPAPPAYPSYPPPASA